MNYNVRLKMLRIFSVKTSAPGRIYDIRSKIHPTLDPSHLSAIISGAGNANVSVFFFAGSKNIF